jgi:hypothetical protein
MRSWAPILALLASLLAVVPAGGQVRDELTLAVRRDFGYRAGDRIQGRFTLEAAGPADLVRVEFRLDQTVMGTAEAAPFRFSFSTSDYALGPHALQAVGTLEGGDNLSSVVRELQFVSAAESWKAGAQLAVPLGLGIAGVIALGVLLPGVFGLRRRRRRPADSGSPAAEHMSGDEQQRIRRSIEDSKYLD